MPQVSPLMWPILILMLAFLFFNFCYIQTLSCSNAPLMGMKHSVSSMKWSW